MPLVTELSLLEAALEQLVDRIARRVLALQEEQRTAQEGSAERSPWMSARSAARHLDWPTQRLYKLTAKGAIPHYKQEGRLLFHRGELDRWLEQFAEGERRLDRLAESELSSRPDQKGAARR